MTDNKSTTDQFWNERALTEHDPAKVNIADDVQRQLETEFIVRHVRPGSRVLEVGCGNGHLTAILREHVAFVDAFDYAENMVGQAKQLHREANNRFFHDNVLDPKFVEPPYDSIVCVRVLINLRNHDEQLRAFRAMQRLLKRGGDLILVEGFRNGFDRLNEVRQTAGIEPLRPASINFYSPLETWLPLFQREFEVVARFHTGSFDFLTRVVYPALVGAAGASGPSDFHVRIKSIAQTFNPDAFAELARVHGFVLRAKH